MSDEQISDETTGLSIDAGDAAEQKTAEDQRTVQTGSIEGTTETSMEATEPEEERLLAGKFQTQEELEKSYVELQRKMSSGSQTDQLDMQGFMEFVGLAAEDVAANWQADGALTQDQYDSFATAGLGKDVVNTFMLGQMALANQAQMSATDAMDRAVDLAGGRQSLENLMSWANDTLGEERKTELNVRLDNPRTMESALKEVLFDYKSAIGSGYAGSILSGEEMPNTSAAFTTVDEFTKAMKKVNDVGHLDEATRRRIANTPLHITQGLNP